MFTHFNHKFVKTTTTGGMPRGEALSNSAELWYPLIA